MFGIKQIKRSRMHVACIREKIKGGKQNEN